MAAPKPLKLSDKQRAIFIAVGRVSRRSPDAWYRAGDAKLGHCRGEAVTLSSLHPSLLIRRRRPDDAHAWEYRLAPAVLGVVDEVVTARAAEKAETSAVQPRAVLRVQLEAVGARR